jgi:hypothetical protein
MKLQCLDYKCPSTFENEDQFRKHLEEKHKKLRMSIYKEEDEDGGGTGVLGNGEDAQGGKIRAWNSRRTGARILVLATKIFGNGSSSIAPQFYMFVVFIIILVWVPKRWKKKPGRTWRRSARG